MMECKNSEKLQQVKHSIKNGIFVSVFLIMLACGIKDFISIGFAAAAVLYTLFIVIKFKKLIKQS